ncbi:hypothetical protein JW826_03705 [Candidatus Woesearchaeota archaeon]|nr:hypothetical protein [Candidatus Woesearchaeota archaeon]
MDALLKYVSEQLKKGYQPSQIKDVLVRQGYSPALVDGVLESVLLKRGGAPRPSPAQAGPISSSSSSSSSSIIVLGGIVAIIAIIVLGIMFVPKMFTKEALLDVMTTPDQGSYHPGEEVGFDLEIFNMGSKDRFDITLIYRVLDEKENVVASKEETVAVSTSTSYHKNVDLPTSMKPGDYTLKVFANYDKKIATSSFSFKIEPKEIVLPEQRESCFDKKQNQDETEVDCGGVCGGYWYNEKCNAVPSGSQPTQTAKEGTCRDGIKNQDESGIDCGGVCGGYWYDLKCHDEPKPASTSQDLLIVSKKSTGAKLIDLKVQAKTDPEGANQGCLASDEDKIRDTCIKSVAQASMQSKYCELIISDNERDLCYYPFFMQGDYAVCEKLVLKESLQTCAQLKQISGMTQNLQAQATTATPIPEENTPEGTLPEGSE